MDSEKTTKTTLKRNKKVGYIYKTVDDGNTILIRAVRPPIVRNPLSDTCPHHDKLRLVRAVRPASVHISSSETFQQYVKLGTTET